MSEQVKRWDHSVTWAGIQIVATTMALREGGKYTLADDYDALAQRCRELEAERAEQWTLRRDAEADRDTGRAVAAELRAEVADLKARLPEAERGAEELVRLRAENRELEKDTARIDWLADQARMVYGRRDVGSYQLAELPYLIQSSREECRPDDLRRAIDEEMEAAHDEG